MMHALARNSLALASLSLQLPVQCSSSAVLVNFEASQGKNSSSEEGAPTFLVFLSPMAT
jgi:hypothetical protein